ncbi:secondary thiamine-phosphate synthase enzyme YjbQ [Lentisphaerota bacterium ZTH]|nr:YjbQ family protein [Lentisphaerota bacterium]WET06887.1 secondary thiamine-phosphate synthase enzyme YjbQ [Lentisphaerota bacterium ZTH]
MKEVNIRTGSHSQLVDITSDIQSLIPAGFKSGICHVFCKHTTAGLTINENADPDVQKDIIVALEKLIPWNSPEFRHFEGNSAAHLKASFMGFAQTVPVREGKLDLGTWQGIYFCEFDGPRSRKVTVQFIKDVDCDA